MTALVGWSEENMKQAIEAVNNNSTSQRQAAFAIGVPNSSLNDKFHEKQSGKNGRDTLLSTTCEISLVAIILFIAGIEFAMTKVQIIDVIKNYL